MVENTHPTLSLTGRLAVVGLALALVAGACGSDSDGVSSEAAVDIDDGAASDPEATSSEATDTGATDTGGDVGDESQSEPAGVAVQENGPIAVEGTSLAVFDSTIPDDTVGTPAPVISGEDFDGSAVTLGGPSDNATMIVFLAHWCPHCNDEIPELISLNDAGSIPAGLDVIGVSTAVDAQAPNFPPSQWVVDKEWPWATMADDEELTAIAAMGGSSFPFTVILDADGNVLARKGGQASAAETLDFINAALA